MIESALTQGNNLTHTALRKPNPNGLMQVSKYYKPETHTAVTETRRADCKVDNVGTAAIAAPPCACAPLDISVEDWDILFRAVEERLRRMVDERSAATDHPRMHDMRGSVRETVLECVAALDQLHAALKR